MQGSAISDGGRQHGRRALDGALCRSRGADPRRRPLGAIRRVAAFGASHQALEASVARVYSHVAHYALQVTESTDHALEDDETTAVLGIETVDGISEAWSEIKNEVNHDYALVGLLLNPTVLEERLDKEASPSTTCTTPRSASCAVSTSTRATSTPSSASSTRRSRSSSSAAPRVFAQVHLVPLFKAGKISKWHQEYSLPFATVSAYPTMKVTSKANDIGGVERNWADAKRA